MVEDVLKTKSSTGPDENNRLQVDVRFLDRERLGEVAGAAVTRGNFLKLRQLLGADAPGHCCACHFAEPFPIKESHIDL